MSDHGRYIVESVEDQQGNELWTYKLTGHDHDLEIFDTKFQATCAAIGHIILLKKEFEDD